MYRLGLMYLPQRISDNLMNNKLKSLKKKSYEQISWEFSVVLVTVSVLSCLCLVGVKRPYNLHYSLISDPPRERSHRNGLSEIH